MSLMQSLMTTVAKHLPDRDGDTMLDGPGLVGQPINRTDGRLKVQGAATYSAEYKVENLAYAALVYSTISKGKIVRLDSRDAEQQPGVLGIISHLNAPKLAPPPTLDPSGNGSSGAASSDLPILQGPEIHWNGQAIAIVVAETQDQADHAAALVSVEYAQEEADLDFQAQRGKAVVPKDVSGKPSELEIGDAETALAAAPVKIDESYVTPRHNHGAIEPHASVAFWSEDGKTLVAFEGSQMLHGFKNTMATVFGIEPAKVRILSPFVGGAFGSKSLWSNSLLCALAARMMKRPVKLALSREGVFRLVGGRTPSEQRVALGAGSDGKLTSLIHTGLTATTLHNNYPEQFSFPARHIYASENLKVAQKIVYLDTVANTFMRAPGESIGGFALETAMDELAVKLAMDPIELRRINEPIKDPTDETKFSQRDIILAYERGAKAFGWKHQPAKSQRDGGWLIGQGVATAYYPYYRMDATARLLIKADGSAVVSTAAHDMGMGTATAQIQHAAQRLGLPMSMVSFEYGDSDLPVAPMAGGSNQTASLVAAVTAAIERAQRDLLDMTTSDSPLAIAKLEDVEARDQGLYLKSDPSQGETYAELMRKAGETQLEVLIPAPPPLELLKYSMHSHGAQFVEVKVKESTGEVRLTRVLGSYDVGRVLNAKTATSQLRGGMIMGIGMALTEETLFDHRYGRIVNPSMAEYHVPVNLDVPPIEVIYNDIPDPFSPLGLRGIGEIGITGIAAAIGNAIYNATGKRVRDLPFTLDKLMG